MLTISQLAREIGVCVETLRRWDKQGSLRPQARTPGGHRRYLLSEVMLTLGASPAPEVRSERVVVGYSRVSSHDQKDDLVRQTERLKAYLQDEPRALLIADLGSGLNFQKRGLCKLIRLITAGRVERLVVTHKDRLLRFGFELIEKMVVAHGGTIEVLEDVRGTDDAELAKDVLTIITVFSARLYGRRAHQHRVAA
jgi:predicted site-specific integrase-resolvase